MEKQLQDSPSRHIGSSSEILLIGVGNLYRSDDGIGIVIARRIEALHLPHVRVKEQSGEGTSLMEEWGNAHRVIVVDAVSSGQPPGTVHRFDASKKSIPKKFFHYSSHSFGLAEAVEVARALHTLPQQLIIYGVEGKSFEDGGAISSEIAVAAQKVVASVLQELHLTTQDSALAFDAV